MGTAPAVENVDLTSAKDYRVATGPYDILANDPRKVAGAGGVGRPCRAISCVGTITVKNLDDITVVLPDMGSAWQWDIQATEIVSGVVVVLW